MTVPAVAVKLAVVLPASTVTEVGTVKAVLLSEIETAIPVVAALERVTVQVLLAPEANEVGLQTRAVGVIAGAVRATEAVLEVPFKVAVTVTV